MQQYFLEYQYIDANKRKKIAEELGLTESQVSMLPMYTCKPFRYSLPYTRVITFKYRSPFRRANLLGTAYHLDVQTF